MGPYGGSATHTLAPGVARRDLGISVAIYLAAYHRLPAERVKELIAENEGDAEAAGA